MGVKACGVLIDCWHWQTDCFNTLLQRDVLLWHTNFNATGSGSRRPKTWPPGMVLSRVGVPKQKINPPTENSKLLHICSMVAIDFHFGTDTNKYLKIVLSFTLVPSISLVHTS